MGFVESVLTGVCTAVISTFVVEWVREKRKEGTQWLERTVDFVVDVLREIVSLVKSVF